MDTQTKDSEPSTREQVRAMSESGMTPRQIARALEVSTQNVYKHMKALGIDPPAKRAAS